MINMDMQNDPRNWTSNTEWSNFYWANNALGIYKIISDRLLNKLTPEIIELYSSSGYKFSSSNAIGSMEKLDKNNLLLDREFSTSIWLVVDNYDHSTCEKLDVILNREKFEMTYTDQADNIEKIEIPYYVEESPDFKNLNNEIIDISYWGNKIKKMLMAELPELDDNKPKTGHKYHVIDVQFEGTVKIEISNKIH